MTPLTLATLAYVALQLGVGFWVSRRVKTEEDYLLAGRSLGMVMSIFTVFATWFGTETCIGAAGQAYSVGLSTGVAVYAGGSHLLALPHPYLTSLAASAVAFIAGATLDRQRAAAPAHDLSIEHRR